ncbi:YtxH domain-containing protein [Pontibacter chitinilyticus]|uniref:YtxH domain-containing protein n=1 Tax=Pontibacter chitinilyticus TaxID=2674989 RepID=UPI00321ABFEC
MECRTLGEERGNFSNSSIRQIKQKSTDFSRSGNGHKSHKQNDSGTGKLAVGLLAGAGVGVLAGMLLAPDKGKVLRQQVVDSATKVGDQVKEKVSSLTGKKDSSTSTSSVGTVHKSPYTDPNKWEDQEVKNMTDTAKNTPGL